MSGNRRGPGRPRRNVSEEPKVDPNADPWIQVMQALQQQMQRQYETHQQLMQMMQQGPMGQQRENPAFREFCWMNPPVFEGNYVPTEACEWIHWIEGTLKATDCSEEEKVVFATRMFRGAACDWWKGARAHMTANQIGMNWNNFRRLFLAHYIPDSFQFQMEQELSEFKQKNLSVEQYTRRFNELVRYSSIGDNAPSERGKINKYIFGLRGDIAHHVSMQTITDFGDLVHKSYVAEDGLQRIMKEKDDAYQRRKESGKFNQQLKPQGSPNKRKQNYSPRSPRACPNCGVPHGGECLKGKGVCYQCKQPGHVKNECPSKH